MVTPKCSNPLSVIGALSLRVGASLDYPAIDKVESVGKRLLLSRLWSRCDNSHRAACGAAAKCFYCRTELAAARAPIGDTDASLISTRMRYSMSSQLPLAWNVLREMRGVKCACMPKPKSQLSSAEPLAALAFADDRKPV